MARKSTTSKSSKMLLRGELVRLVSKYSNVALIKNDELAKDICFLKSIEDREYVIKFLLKEIVNEDEKNVHSQNSNILALFVLEVSDAQMLENIALDFLVDSKVPDNKKFFLISVLGQKGIKIDIDEMSDYIDDPDIAAKEGVKKFLNDITTDLETQVDMLDFYTNIPPLERVPLIKNIVEESEPDNIALVLSLISLLYSEKKQFLPDEFNIIIDELPKTMSPYALEGLNHILENFELDLKQRAKINKAIKEINSIYPNFKNDAAFANTKIYKTYVGFVDGRSNFSLIFSRISKEGIIKVFLVLIDIDNGIVATVGFCNLLKENFKTILDRLFCDSLSVEINPIALKGICEHWMKKNFETKTPLPYEYLIYRRLFSDVKNINYDIEEFLVSKLDTINLTKNSIRKFAASKVLSSWYYTKNENEKIDNLISQIEKKHITDFDILNSFIKKYIEENFLNDEVFLKSLERRLKVTSYVAHLAHLKMSSMVAYSLCFKNKYTDFFIQSIIDKSIYHYFSSILEYMEVKDSIFKRKNETVFTKDELIKLAEGFEEKWSLKNE